ncbi:hypothetical protein AWB67_04940 [Caballeronia terrestris]|jgi:hypothetical protein|uniref:Uncharacterized protein n=1 Tax=Caballeronia terrestris TaxID=1226301 RepID=A0A158K7R2_9BURK|nr:hypothetical protein AWB67_04940 [Caballeronia terrestris]
MREQATLDCLILCPCGSLCTTTTHQPGEFCKTLDAMLCCGNDWLGNSSAAAQPSKNPIDGKPLLNR